MAVFLTKEWFDEVTRLSDEAGDLNLPPSLANMKLNLQVTECTQDGQDEIQAYLADGKLHQGTTEAQTTLILPEAILKDLAFNFDTNKAMQAFMDGKIRVEGDMSQLMALQTAKPSDEQKQLFKKIYKMTEQA